MIEAENKLRYLAMYMDLYIDNLVAREQEYLDTTFVYKISGMWGITNNPLYAMCGFDNYLKSCKLI